MHTAGENIRLVITFSNLIYKILFFSSFYGEIGDKRERGRDGEILKREKDRRKNEERKGQLVKLTARILKVLAV